MNESIYTMKIHPLVKPLKININSIFEIKKKRDLDGIFCDSFLVFSLISGLGVKLGRQVSGAIFKSKRRQRVVQEIGEYTIDIKVFERYNNEKITNLSYYYF